MFFNCRSHSFPAVQFKSSLPVLTNLQRFLSKTSQNIEKDDNLSRGRPSMVISDPTHFTNRLFTQSFFSNFLKLYAKNGFLSEGKQLHACMIKLGFYDGALWLQNQLVNVYIKCKQVEDARKLFDEISVRNVVTWNTLISGLVDCGWSFFNLGFSYFRTMRFEMCSPDSTTYTGLLKLCVELSDIEIGWQLHCLVTKVGLCKDCFVTGVLVELYSNFGLVKDARQVFDSVVDRDIILWNVMVSCYASNGLGEDAFGVFKLMELKGVKGDEFTFTSLLSVCSNGGFSEVGRLIHGLVIRQGFDLDVVIASVLIDMYIKNEIIDDAHKIFVTMISRNVISWNTLIVGYGQHGYGREAAVLLLQMLQEGYNPDELTLASVLSSCGNLPLSCEIVQLHAYALKTGFLAFLLVGNALINAYSKCGDIVSASISFNLIVEPNLVSWTSIVGACAFHSLSREGIQLFEKMLSNKIKPDRVAFIGVLSACCHGGLVREGFHYFALMSDGYGIMPDLDHYTCLIDLLGRCGLLSEALNILLSMPIEPGPDSLGAFIGACKVHGNVELAKWAAEQLLILEPYMPVNYTLMSNMYASAGCWYDVSRVRKMMRENCHFKVPGCSWMEIAGEVHTFVSSDKSHPKTQEMDVTLGMMFSLMKDNYCMPSIDFVY